MVLPDGRVESCGNFHGAPLAFACDALAIAVAEVGAIAERRTDRLLDASRSSGLPPFLAPDAGVNSGLMIAQYTQAALVAENRRLAAPASVGSLPTSAMQEDHVSMGWAAARKLRVAVANLAKILAVELVCAARGVELRAPLGPGAGTGAALAAVRAAGIEGCGPDRWLSPELARADVLVRGGALLDDVEQIGRSARVSGPRRVRAARGSELSCQGWQQEAALRMLCNNLDPEVAENPDELVVYGGTGRAVRSWEAFDAIARTLRTLRADETLLVQSGKPVGVFRTHEWAPRVLLANSNLVPEWATWDEFRRLEALGLTMYGQMTAGSWIYIGSQGIVQGTYECFAEIARRHHGGSLAGTITLTAGLGGMGGAQPLAVTMNGGVALCVEVDPEHIRRRLRTRYLDEVADSLEDAVARAVAARDARRAVSIGLCANASDVLPALLRAGFQADIVTDQTSAHDPLGGYVPGRMTLAEARRCARPTPTSTSAARAPRSPRTAPRWSASSTPAPRSSTTATACAPRRSSAASSARSPTRASCPRTCARCSARARGRFAGSRCPATPPTSRRPTAPCSRSSPRTRRSRAGSHTLASGSPSRGCRRGSAGWATASGRGWACASTRWSPPGSFARRSSSAATTSTPARSRRPIARPRAWPTSPTRSPTGRCSTRSSTPRAARRGCRSTTAAASASAARSTPGWSASPTAPRLPRRSSSAC